MKKAYMDGFVAGEPEEKGTQNGYMLIFGFNSANNRRKPDGTWESAAEFFDCKYFYKDADDAVAQAIMAKKGKMLLELTPHQERWEKDGKSRSKVTFTVEGAWLKPSRPEAETAPDDLPF